MQFSPGLSTLNAPISNSMLLKLKLDEFQKELHFYTDLLRQRNYASHLS